jgi:hypothetical protein
MTLTAVEQTKFRAYIANRLLREIEILIPEYIHTNPYLIEDIEDKGYDEVEEAYVQDAFNIAFHWTPDPYGKS